MERLNAMNQLIREGKDMVTKVQRKVELLAERDRAFTLNEVRPCPTSTGFRP